jgi:nucleotide-binding universal stress UspA family protein
MYERILVPTDGSDDAARAADHAVAIAGRFGATLYGLSVVETRTGYDNALDAGEVERALHEDSEAALADLRDRADAAGVDCETELREGVPPEEILAFARERDVDLVVMGAHGSSAFREVLLGSATEYVLREGDVPVLVAE